MFEDHFSPSAPTRVRTLVLPVGRIRRSRFCTFHDLLTQYCEIRLGDVTPDPRPERSAFSPLAFPDGFVLYHFSTDMPSHLHVALSPFELFREPLVVIGILDSQEYESPRDDDAQLVESQIASAASAAIAELEEKFPRVLVHKIIAFDFDSSRAGSELPLGVFSLAPETQSKPHMVRTLMCDITSALLAEMPILLASIKALPSIPSPATGDGAPYAHHQGTFSPPLSRSNSQSGEAIRSPSPNTNHMHRMSMPVFPSSGIGTNNAIQGHRPTSPEARSGTPPAKTFEELINHHGSHNNKAQPADSRSDSRDRVSISGFGPSSIEEKHRNKGRCRVSIVMASILMLAGRWNDALRDLADAAGQARSNSDHIWHAKALENMMTCLVLLAWAEIPFKIPPICYPVLDRTSSKLAQLAVASLPTSNASTSHDHTAARRELASVLSDLANVILGLYNRAASFSNTVTEFLPQIAYSEFVIRTSKILAAIQIGEGTFNNDALAYAIRGVQRTDTRVQNSGDHRHRVCEVLMRAMPGPFEVSGLSALDEASILAGMASVLSAIRLQRKKALILKEYVAVLIRALDESKKTEAAEAGFHPSSNGLAVTPASKTGAHNAPQGLNDFLNVLCRIYGIPEYEWSRSIGAEALHPDTSSANDVLSSLRCSENLIGNFILHTFGNVRLKSDILRLCIMLCEALPDPHGVLHWTSVLLRTAGPSTTIERQLTDVPITLSREEQHLLSSTMSQTIAHAQTLRLAATEADYWDEFLVRGVVLVESQDALTLHPHQRSDLVANGPRQPAKVGPFIHNPFLKKPTAQSAMTTVVAEDSIEIMLLLQNLYDFDISIESIAIGSEFHEFGRAQNILLRPLRTQDCSVRGILPPAAQHKLDRCTVKITGCRERTFFIFADTWKPVCDSKIKSIGLLPPTNVSDGLSSDPSTSLSLVSDQAYPSPTSIPLTIIPPQAVLEVIDISVPQSSLMLLEGEKATVFVTIENKSTSIVADFIHLSFNDSTKVAVQEALNNRKLMAIELYELEIQLTHLPAVQLAADKPMKIEPKQRLDLKFEVLGKPGLTNPTILVDYASLTSPHLEHSDEFFTRQISIPLSVTVNSSIQLHRVEVLPLAKEYIARGTLGTQEANAECCLLVLDLRNVWPSPLEISLELIGEQVVRSTPISASTTQEVVQPGHISRMVMIIPKIHVKKPHARIRAANERQYVVSSNGMSPENERASREQFWYREALLKVLKATWRQEGGTKSGAVDLRSSLRLTPRMVDALKLDDVEIRLSIDSEEDGKSKSDVKVDEHVSIKTRIHNWSDATIHPLLRLRPSLSHQPIEHALDLSKRLAWSGVLQTVLPPVAPGTVIETSIGLCVLCVGEYEIGATVEEMLPSSMLNNGESEDTIPDLLGTDDRRIWTAGTPCRISSTE